MFLFVFLVFNLFKLKFLLKLLSVETFDVCKLFRIFIRVFINYIYVF